MVSYSRHESELISLISEICSVFETVKSKESTLEVGLSWHPQRHYTKSSTDSNTELESKLVSLLTQIISVLSLLDFDSMEKPHSAFVSHITQIISVYKSLWDSEPESELVSLVSQIISIGSSKDSTCLKMRKSAKLSVLFKKIFTLTPEPELISLVNQLTSLVQSKDVNPELKFRTLYSELIIFIGYWELQFNQESVFIKQTKVQTQELVPLITGIVSVVKSMNLDSQPMSELKSRIRQMISLFSSLSKSEPESELVLSITKAMHLVISVVPDSKSKRESDLLSLLKPLRFLEPEPEIMSLFDQLTDFMAGMQVEKIKSDSVLISHIDQLASLLPSMYSEPDPSLHQVISKVAVSLYNLDLDSEPKSELKLQVSQIYSLFNSLIESDPESELVSLASQIFDFLTTTPLSGPTEVHAFISLFKQLFSLEPEPEIMTLVKNMMSQYKTGKWAPEWWISLSPQVEVKLQKGKFSVIGKIQRQKEEKGTCTCNKEDIDFLRQLGDSPGYFRCPVCNGEDIGDIVKAPIEVEHPHHPEHSLQLVMLTKNSGTRECFCCDEDIKAIFYYCSDCDHAMNISCMVKTITYDIYNSEWHEEHGMLLFPRRAFLTCNACAVADLSSPIYICPPCDFVIHQKCLSLPSVIEISRHPHRISFTFSFDQRGLSCGICQRDIDDEYGGYSCIKDECSYVAHSRCATRKNLWDGKELEGQPEEEDKEVMPFERISDGVIHHFSHKRHYLRLDKETSRDYDEDKKCRACVMPIYDGNFYSCMECEFILHEACANLSRKIHHPIHPHPLTLMRGYGDIVNTKNSCSACPWLCTGFFYQCKVDGCDLYKLHVQCATISEPLVHASHMHPLFLTSDPGVERTCWDCKGEWAETFNCIGECDFALCYGCATLPQKVRYKHDKHMLTLSYGEETSTVMSWCEVCEKKLKPKERVYRCDEYCSVTLHTHCLIGGDFYMKPGLSLFHLRGKIDLLRNNHHMDRPFCTYCKKRCSGKNVFQCFGSIYCSRYCICYGIKYGE